jgi:hypothetical protein
MQKFLHSLRLTFFSILSLIGLLTPSIGQPPQKRRRYRTDGATATLKANQLRDGAGTILRRSVTGLSGFWRFRNDPRMMTA